jgi:flagellar protein FliL
MPLAMAFAAAARSTLPPSMAGVRSNRHGGPQSSVGNQHRLDTQKRRQAMAGRDTEAEDQEKSEEKKKSPLIKIIILVVLLAILGGGGYVGYLKFLKPPPPVTTEPPVEQSVSADGGTFLVNLSDPGGKRYLKVTVQFELSGQKANEELSRRNVEMRDLIIMLLSSKEYTEIGNASGKVSLKRELLRQVNKMLHDGQVKEIYFTEFLVQ